MKALCGELLKLNFTMTAMLSLLLSVRAFKGGEVVDSWASVIRHMNGFIWGVNLHLKVINAHTQKTLL